LAKVCTLIDWLIFICLNAATTLIYRIGSKKEKKTHEQTINLVYVFIAPSQINT